MSETTGAGGVAPTPTRRVHLPARGTFVVLAPLTGESLEAALRAHQNNRGTAACLKWKYDTLVTRIPVESCPGSEALVSSGEIVVKEVPLPWRRKVLCRLGVPSRFERDFERYERLAAFGFRAPRVLGASFVPKGDREYQFTAFAAGDTLGDLLWMSDTRAVDADMRSSLLHSVGKSVRALHERGVWQRDLNPLNLLLQRPDDGWTPLLLDITALRFFSKPLPRARRLRNLAQLVDLPKRLEEKATKDLLDGYLKNDAADRKAWERELREGVNRRRARRLRRTGFRYIDDEHYGTASHTGELPKRTAE